ncbi:MAG TPA: M3 family metallopeptidase [Burkholderiaceae bacterium]|nr:M3 family metallopeptidase [Burkholderiaceae bacterium]
MHRLLLCCIWLCVAGRAVAATASLPGPAFPNFQSPDALQAHCDRGLGQAHAGLRALERHRVDPGWFAAYDELNAMLEDLAGPVYLLSNVHPDKAIRDAAEACELRWQDFTSSLSQNATLYAAVRRLRARDPVDALLLKTLREDFEDAGVSLPPSKRKRAKEINDRVNALGQEFDRNIRDENIRLAFSIEQLRGVPEPVWRSAQRDDRGQVLLGVDTPTYMAVMQGAADAVTRERMWRAKTDEGGERNLQLLAEISRLRKEYAGLFGFASYADFTLRRRMAHSAREAQAFLDDVLKAVSAREAVELGELRAAKARDLNLPPAQVTLQRWDAMYYQERVRRERFAVDQEAFRAYFPPQASLAFVMRVIEKMMGVRYVRVDGLTLWHPDVQAYSVVDAGSGQPIAALYVDPYPRDGKYNHAAVWSFRNGSLRLERAPQAALVVNVAREGLTLDDLETLLHEFGHAVHNNLSATRYSAQAGTSVLRDFVEAPSQMLEQWVYDPKVQHLMREVCPACEPVPEPLLAQAAAARRYGKGMAYARQWLYAAYDLALHGNEAADPMVLWARMEGASALGHQPGTMFPAGFSHVATGYGAGYYGYLWSEVVAADLRTAFAADHLDPAVGGRYRRIVLANGSQVPPRVLVRQFLGRDGNARAFFEDLQR